MVYDIRVRSKTPRIQRNGYLDIVETIRERISQGEIPAGRFLGTEKELQLEFGAARSTIRKVLGELVRLGWAQSIPSKGVFAARGLAPTNSSRIALVENGTYVQNILCRHFAQVMSAEGFSIERVGGTELYPLEYALQQVMDGGYAGAFVWCFHAYPDPDLVGRLSQTIPVVSLDHRMGMADTDLVEFDHEQASYDLTTHLIKQGCRRIGLTGMLDTLDSTTARIQGYMRALFDHEMKPNPADFAFVSTSGGDRCETGLLEMRLRAPERPDGYVIINDHCSADVAATALRCGLNLPRDLKLGAVGNDYEVTCNGLAMTAIQFDWIDLAELAMELMRDRLEDLHRPSQRRRARHRLVVGGLSGALAGQPDSAVESFSPALPQKPGSHFSSSWTFYEGPPLS
jgi:DNA-binding LacI/PurR family transcriptional regulator